VDYSAGTLLIRNGPREIENIVVTADTGSPSVGSATADPGEEINITDISQTGDVDLTLTYDVVGGLTGHSDTATIRN
jgi:hypothetical protein